MRKTTIAVVAGCMAWSGFGLAALVTRVGAAPPAGFKTIDATQINQKVPSCGGGLAVFALFTISGIDTPADIPHSIVVDQPGGVTDIFPTFPPGPHQQGLAVYKGPTRNGVTGATALIYDTWEGSFILEEYFCGTGSGRGTTTTTSSSTTTTTSSSTTTTTTTEPGSRRRRRPRSRAGARRRHSHRTGRPSVRPRHRPRRARLRCPSRRPSPVGPSPCS